MKRMSSLPILQYCGRAADLDVGAGRAAAKSSAFHAYCAGLPEAEAMLMLLTEDERAEVMDRKPPEDLVVAGQTLRYADAQVEFELALMGNGTIPNFGQVAEFTGHPDMAWVIETAFGRVAVIGDIKATRYTSEPNSLQLRAYGHTFAMENGCVAFVTAIWTTDDGEWIRGDMVTLGSDEHMQFLAVLKAIATRETTDYATGTHCHDCWSRMRCPAHMVQMENGPVYPGTNKSELDDETALELLLWVERQADTIKATKDLLKAYAKVAGGVPDGKGKIWGEVWFKGKESAPSAKTLRSVMGEKANELITQGMPYTQHRWTLVRSK